MTRGLVLALGSVLVTTATAAASRGSAAGLGALPWQRRRHACLDRTAMKRYRAGQARSRCSLVCVLAVVAVLAVVLAGTGPAGASRVQAAGTSLPVAGATLHGPFDGATCPQGAAQGANCWALDATGTVRGLGMVVQSGVLVIDAPDTACATFQSTPLLTVAGKGTIELSTQTPAGGCIDESAATGAVDSTEELTVTGGTGAYAGASGNGTVKITGKVLVSQTDTLTVTIVAPSANFDLTPPAINGASGKTVRAPKGKTRVRVRYAVTAKDAVDGTVQATCKPASESFFKIGRTRVSCTATDSSANTSTARFIVTVKR
jgi:HYR domain